MKRRFLGKEDCIDILIAISIITRRMAKKLSEQQKKERKRNE